MGCTFLILTRCNVISFRRQTSNIWWSFARQHHRLLIHHLHLGAMNGIRTQISHLILSMLIDVHIFLDQLWFIQHKFTRIRLSHVSSLLFHSDCPLESLVRRLGHKLLLFLSLERSCSTFSFGTAISRRCRTLQTTVQAFPCEFALPSWAHVWTIGRFQIWEFLLPLALYWVPTGHTLEEVALAFRCRRSNWRWQWSIWWLAVLDRLKLLKPSQTLLQLGRLL